MSTRKKTAWGLGRHLSGFTTIDVLLTCSLIAFLLFFVVFLIGKQYSKAKTSRAMAELTQVADAAHQYIIDHHGEFPSDVNRGLPPGIESYLNEGSWPQGPWPGSVYDWDVFPDVDYGPNYQISIRFCPLGQPTRCQFPKEPWAANFDYYSSVYICMEGDCKAHPSMPENHPGYCILGCGS